MAYTYTTHIYIFIYPYTHMYLYIYMYGFLNQYKIVYTNAFRYLHARTHIATYTWTYLPIYNCTLCIHVEIFTSSLACIYR